MISMAFRMMIGNRAAFIGAIFGIFLAILLISQQSAIYLGLVERSYRIVSDIPEPNVWVIDPATRWEQLIRPMPKNYLQVVRSTPGIKWATPVNYLLLPLTTSSGEYTIAEVYGIDDATLIGLPELVAGNAECLHREGGVILDAESARHLLATTLPNGQKAPLKVGDTVEINGHRAVIVGLSKTQPGFYPQPIIFTTISQVQLFSGSSHIQFIAAKTSDNSDERQVLKEINKNHNLLGLTSHQLKARIGGQFLQTGISVNYLISVLLGLIIGISISGQIFYIMTLHNLSHYALIKSLGGTEKMIFKMILFQALVISAIGYILGTGVSILWGVAIKNTTLAFKFPWELLLLTGFFAVVICAFIGALSVKKVAKLDPHLLMTGAL